MKIWNGTCVLLEWTTRKGNWERWGKEKFDFFFFLSYWDFSMFGREKKTTEGVWDVWDVWDVSERERCVVFPHFDGRRWTAEMKEKETEREREKKKL